MPTEPITVALRLGVLFFLVPALGAKLAGPGRFRQALSSWRVLPGRAVGPASMAVVAAEAFVAVTLASGIATWVGAVLGTVLFATFAAGAASVIQRGIATSCACFSLDVAERVSWITVSRATMLAIACLTLASSAYPGGFPGATWEATPVLLLFPLAVPVLRRALRVSGLRSRSAA